MSYGYNNINDPSLVKIVDGSSSPIQYNFVPIPEQQEYLFETPGVVKYKSHWIDFWTIIIAIIIVVLFVLLFVILFWPNTITEVTVTIKETSDPVNSTIGSSDNGKIFLNNGENFTDQTSCILSSNRKWGNKCSCFTPFYGSKCQLESYSNNYNAIGNPDLNTLELQLSDKIPVERLSFPFEQNNNNYNLQQVFNQTSQTNISDQLCTDICDNNNDCRGIIWTPAPGNDFGIGAIPDNKPKCQLIRSSVTVLPGNNIPYSSDVQSSLYMKTQYDPQFKDRVFVFMGNKAVRYWLQTTYSDTFGDNQGRTMFDGQLIRFDWTPTNVINTTGSVDTNGDTNTELPWVGIFSDGSFDITNSNFVDQLITKHSDSINIFGQTPFTLNNSQQYIIVLPNDTTINIPASWRQLWGAFTSNYTNSSNNQVNSQASELQNYQTSRNIINQSNQDSTLASLLRDTKQTRKSNDLVSVTHSIIWNKNEFPVNGSGKVININIGDKIRIMSTDDYYHDLVSTNSNWSTTSTPFNFGVANPFTSILEFNYPGTYYIKDRINPLLIRLAIIVGNINH